MPPPNDVGFYSGQSGGSFYRILSEAINEMAGTGFDNSERLAFWIKRIRDAAVQSLIPEHVLEAQLNAAFRATFRRLVEKGGIVKFHAGVGRFTLEKVRPALRAELDRRMMISRNLIKLNRAEAIEATVRRFAGWASSVPDGGTGAVDRRETKVEIRKALASLPFVARRVAVDQGHKFVSNLNNILATDGGAIALIWHSHWRQAGYNYRRDHKERDGKVYVLRGNWALDRGFMKLAGRTYYDEVTAVGEEVYCRCYAVYLYSLRALPDDMVTEKGRVELERAKALVGA
jgi:hypothetical protein